MLNALYKSYLFNMLVAMRIKSVSKWNYLVW